MPCEEPCTPCAATSDPCKNPDEVEGWSCSSHWVQRDRLHLDEDLALRGLGNGRVLNELENVLGLAFTRDTPCLLFLREYGFLGRLLGRHVVSLMLEGGIYDGGWKSRAVEAARSYMRALYIC